MPIMFVLLLAEQGKSISHVYSTCSYLILSICDARGDLLGELFVVEHLLPMGQSSTWLLSICPRALKQEIRVLGFTSNLSSTFHYLHLL